VFLIFLSLFSVLDRAAEKLGLGALRKARGARWL